jgi:antitoxin VapB
MRGVREDGRPFERLPARAKLFKHGGSQAVRLPKEFRFEGDEVEIRKDGERVVLGPARRQGGAELWARIDAIAVDKPIEYQEQPVIKDITLDRD